MPYPKTEPKIFIIQPVTVNYSIPKLYIPQDKKATKSSISRGMFGLISQIYNHFNSKIVMKKILLVIFMFCAASAIAQKVESITYEQLTDPEQAKFVSKKINFKSIQMPNGLVLKIGDVVEIAERHGDKRRKHRGVLEDAYSTLLYGGSGADFLEDAEQDMLTADKGKKAFIYKFKPKKKLDGTFVVEILIKPLSKNVKFDGWNRARASLESFKTGELIKIQ